MKTINQSMLVWMAVAFISCNIFQTGNENLVVLEGGEYSMEINKTNLGIGFIDHKGAMIVPVDSISGLFINEEPVIKADIIEKKQNELLFSVINSRGSMANVRISFEREIATISVVPEESGKSKVSLRFGGMPVAHGLGDAGGWNKTFDLAGKEKNTFNIQNDGGRKRWLSTFTIFPKNNFAAVFFDRGKKSVVISEDTYQLNTEIDGASTFYLFLGNPKEIYANYKKVRNEVGYEDIVPKSRLFELGWESWDALGWNTNQETVKDILAKFHAEGYPIRWAVTGSGFWETGGTTTNFGKWGNKFPNPETIKVWMHNHDIKWMIGLRTNFVPKGGPYIPISSKRDRNLKGNSYNGNLLSEEGVENNYFLKDINGDLVTVTSQWFPQVPCYLLDGDEPGSAQWYQKKYLNWMVDGIKEDTMMDIDSLTNIYNKPIAEIAREGGLVMARNGEFTSPGTLLRINDTGVGQISQRIPINYMQYAASGFPNVYSDVAGVHNMQNTEAVDANIRHSWLLSLTAGMALGAFPTQWTEEEQAIFKKSVAFHYSLGPYLYSAGMKAFKTGYPYTLTPMSIAFPEDEQCDVESFQWMIGESVLATPLLKNYKEGKKDIYLPEGTWYDWESGEQFTGPRVLDDYAVPLNKTPCFVGGNGVVILRRSDSDEFIARVYPMAKHVTSEFFTLENGSTYAIQSELYNMDSVQVMNLFANTEIAYSKLNNCIEFQIAEGESYLVKHTK